MERKARGRRRWPDHQKGWWRGWGGVISGSQAVVYAPQGPLQCSHGRPPPSCIGASCFLCQWLWLAPAPSCARLPGGGLCSANFVTSHPPSGLSVLAGAAPPPWWPQSCCSWPPPSARLQRFPAPPSSCFSGWPRSGVIPFGTGSLEPGGVQSSSEPPGSLRALGPSEGAERPGVNG